MINSQKRRESSVLFLGSGSDRGRCPVKHRGEIPPIRLYVCTYVHPPHWASSSCSEAGSGCLRADSGCSEAGSGLLRLLRGWFGPLTGYLEAGSGYLQADSGHFRDQWRDRLMKGQTYEWNFPVFYRTSFPVGSIALAAPSLGPTAYSRATVPLTS